MPLETLQGHDIAALLVQAREKLGENAVVLSLERAGETGYELIAGDGEGSRDDFGAVLARATPATTLSPMLGNFRSRRRGEPAVLALVGPTGSGKTTTIAKLANHPEVFGGLPVGLMCLDTYRVGAIEQSRIYAEISRLPLEIVYEEGDIARALKRLRDREVVLVDTAGRAPSRPGDTSETRYLLRALRPAEVHLAIPAGLDPRMARRVLASHRSLGVTHLLATKMDEFPEDRVVQSLARERGLPMRWMTTGQEVPADLGWAGAPFARVAA